MFTCIEDRFSFVHFSAQQFLRVSDVLLSVKMCKCFVLMHFYGLRGCIHKVGIRGGRWAVKNKGEHVSKKMEI